MEKIFILFLGLLFVLPVASSLDFDIRDSCGGDYPEELFSISNLTNAHAAGPDVFRDYEEDLNGDLKEGKLVCATDVVDANIKPTESCDTIRNPVLSFYDSESMRSHLSPEGVRNDYTLCARRLSTSVMRSCPGDSKPIVSIYDSVENHVAEPGYYSWQVCGALFEDAELAQNFTLSGNKSFVQDGSVIQDETELTTSQSDEDSNYPLYSTAENESLISGIIGNNVHPQNTEIIHRDNVTTVRHRYDRPSHINWFVPFTTGTFFDVEDRLSMIASGDFLNQFNPNFAFNIVDEILVTITLEVLEANIVNDLELGPGTHNLRIQNLGGEEATEVEINVAN